ncbi:AAA family ATPase [Wukongibacter baidiensis]
MELIYLYIKRYRNRKTIARKVSNKDTEEAKGFTIVDTGFNFSDYFRCDFDFNKGLLIQKEEPIYPNFYGECIKSVKLFVGKNGSGKTTVLDLIGLYRDDRFQDHYKTENIVRDIYSFGETDNKFTSEYLTVYHLKDNQFLIEFTGNLWDEQDNWIRNLDSKSVYRSDNNKGNMFYKLPIGFVVDYDFKRQYMRATNLHCFTEYKIGQPDNRINVKEERRLSNQANIYYFSHHFSHRKAHPQLRKARSRQDNSEYLQGRQNIKLGIYEPCDYQAVYRLLCDEEYSKFRKGVFKFKPLIQLTDSYKGKHYSYPIGYSNSIKIEHERLYKNKYSSIKDLLEDNKTELEKMILNVKESYLIDLTERYVLYSLNQLVKMIYDKYNEKAFTESFEMLSEENLIKIVKRIADKNFSQHDILYDEAKNVIEEFENLKYVIKEVCENASKAEKSIDLKSNFVSSDVYELIRKNIFVSRYLQNRIESMVNLGRDGTFQQAFEKVVIKLLKIKPEYFSSTGLVIEMNDPVDNEIDSLFTLMQKYLECEDEKLNDINNHFKFSIPYTSDGERIILDVFSKLLNIIKNEDRELFVLVMDEPDQRLHPDWSRQFLDLLIQMIEKLNKTNFEPQNRKLNVQLIISTHSPFILSDVREEDVFLLYLNEEQSWEERELQISTEKFNVFGANIYDLLKESFFFNRTIGEFANRKMESDFQIFKMDKMSFKTAYETNEITKKQLIQVKYLIDKIGEPVLRHSLSQEYFKRLNWIDEYNERRQSQDVNNLLTGFHKLSREEKNEFIRGLLDQIDKENGDKNDKH